MISEKVIINYKAGIHLRPATEICKAAAEYKSKVKLIVGNVTADAKSIISILGACIKTGTEVMVMCDGEDEELALEAMINILNKSVVKGE